jgi:dehydrogenase/reductase SDR family protein 7B
MSVEGKTIWLTGASSGIGQALARQLASRGARLILSARRIDRLEAIASEYREADIRILPFDLADPDAVVKAAEEALGMFPRLDILINNAGVSQRTLFTDLTPKKIEELYRVNLLSPVHLSRVVARRMMETGNGQLVFVSSLAAYVSIPLRTIYSSAKIGLHAICDALRVELKLYDVAVTLIIPGFVRTEISPHPLRRDETLEGEMDRRQEKGMSPERCARLIVRAIEARKRRFVVAFGIKGWLAIVLKKLMPGLFDWIASSARLG